MSSAVLERVGRDKAALNEVAKACKSGHYLKYGLTKLWMAGAVKRIDERFPAIDLARGFAASLIRVGEGKNEHTLPIPPCTAIDAVLM